MMYVVRGRAVVGGGWVPKGLAVDSVDLWSAAGGQLEHRGWPSCDVVRYRGVDVAGRLD
jgi:hypothetical protein